MTTSSVERRTDLDGRVILVSGAARGQGRAITELAAAAGAKVIAGDMLDAVDDVATADPGVVHACRLDITDPDLWKQTVQSGVQRFGRLDGLVNNAGILHRTILEHETAENFERLWRVNCLGAFLGIQTVLPELRASGGGAIVNTLSTASVTAWTEHDAYAPSKWALRGLSKVAALELAVHGIRVNAVLPGPVLTPIIIRDEDPDAAARLARTPHGRAGWPVDIAETVLFLLSECSFFVTGAEVTVDGGQTAGKIMKEIP